MPELVIEKRHNPVMDLCIAYGLFYIVTVNKTRATLKNFPSAYVITYDTFDAAEADILPPIEDWVNFGPYLFKGRKQLMLDGLYGTKEVESNLVKDNALEAIFEYYATPVPERSVKNIPKHAKKMDYTGMIGTWYGGKGHRTAGSATKGYRVPLFERWLAELGFVEGVSFTNIEDKDYLFWIGIPSEEGLTDTRMLERRVTDPETGEISRSQFIRSHSVEIALARTLLTVQHQVQTDNIEPEYEGALFMRGWFNGNTGSADRVDRMTFFPFDESTTQSCLLHLMASSRDPKVDFQHALSRWLLNRTPKGFYDTVAIMAKEDRWVSAQESEDYLQMAGMTELHTNEGVNRLGRRLNELLYNKRGHTVMLDLMDVKTKEDLMRTVSNLSIEYDKLNKGRYALWNKDELEAFIKEVDNPDLTGQDIASAILLLSKTRQEKKETD